MAQPVERQRVKGIFGPSQDSQEVQFRDLMLHSTSCLDCDLTGMHFSESVRLIFNTALVEMLNRACGLHIRVLCYHDQLLAHNISIYGLCHVIDEQVRVYFHWQHIFDICHTITMTKAIIPRSTKTIQL